MKSTRLITLVLVFAITAYPPSASAKRDELVFDSDGEPITIGASYYLAPVGRYGGGIERTATGNETCPLTVVQSPYDYSPGSPIRFSSPNKATYNIHEGASLDVGFECVPWCAPTPSKFTIVRGDDQQGEQFSVKLSGSSENTVSGSFSFQSANYYGLGLKLKSWRRYAYTLVFCTDDGTCRGVGIYADRYGNLRLVLTQRDPVVLQIRSVTPYAAASA
ncbi:hypothetical protein VNO78_16063 [Psophocarpus tetragonolobus]|uniref:Uncharacterized protein n=1 Tax=Psophocarpus tetragonolobus TaxID=3891 RepID=A0AAN9XKC1_PSOTE